ncbi:biotin operon repressor/biotin--[acetyl CoA carboxylase] ligase [Thermococcus sp. 4557]|uniref:biotin--[acetyl-CoA-carboxylase] ligase n=1 Tax=Thermococcus sp. (strain CGMCC 1.5172 / 4557) TaxID=1042877 RepID=UPI000219EBAB|nr:biotin--[acetyl-CoA-carboxylase] ligase [Thermococcus sp. 4557]AEK74015.1 biotin operon repressor/biotin--[acetyl CoA carboxylase] ligase [Thermococcus sp. 4557]
MRGLIRDSRVKRGILGILRRGERVSGDTMAAELGVSRVAIWKHVRELIALGYTIDSSRKGYTLLSEPGEPYPWELDVRSYYVLRTPSTMDVAGKLAEDGEPGWTFVIAREQTSGRGRRGRRWESRRGGLYFSVILRPDLRLADVSGLVPPTLDAIARTLSRYGIEAERQECGVYVEGRKTAGVLVEAAGELDMVRYAVIGVGLNVSNPVPAGAASVAEILGDAPSLLEVSRVLFGELMDSLGTFLNSRTEVESDAEGGKRLARL